MTHFATLLSITTGILVVVTALVTLLLWISKRLQWLGDFRDDWKGQIARPGVPAVPGVMERIHNLDEGQLEVLRRVAAVELQVHPNGGSSMADKINSIQQVVTSQPQGGRT